MSPSPVSQFSSERYRVPNGAGWDLAMVRSWSERTLDRSRRPLLIVPGYGMNSFIFGFHPRGVSLEGFLVEAGFEVWRVDLRAQGESVSTGGTRDFQLEDLAVTDVSAAVQHALAHTGCRADRVDMIGASLGGTLMFAHAVLEKNHRIASMVSMGGPVRWVKIHPALRIAFSSPAFAGWLQFRGTRKMAEVVLPLVARFAPSVLSIYMNPELNDLSAAREMVKTVEDPNRHINREIAHWFRERDLVIRGVNITDGLSAVTNPLLCIVANSDGIVPPEVAAFPCERVASSVRTVLTVGNETMAMAHADLFVSNTAHETVFRPIATWLAERYAPTPAPRRVEV